MSKPKQPLTQYQLAHILRRSTLEIERLVKKEGLPCKGRKKGVMSFDIAKVVHWLIARHHQKLEDEKGRRDQRTLHELAELFDVEPRTIDKEAKDRGLPKQGRGVFLLSKVIPWKLKDCEKRLKEAKAGGESAIQAKRRLTTLQADIKNIELARLNREVVNREDVVTIIMPLIKAAREKLLPMGRKIAPQTPGLSVAEIEAIIYNHITDALTELANIPKLIRSSAPAEGRDSSKDLQSISSSPKAKRKRVGRSVSKAQPGSKR